MKVVVLVFVLVFVWAAPAAADERAACQSAVDAMVASWPKQRVAATVTCVPLAEIPGYGGFYRWGKAKVGYGYPYPVSEQSFRSTAAHELGHAWADDHLGSRKQRRYMRLRGITSPYWNDAAEDYADVFATAFGEGSFVRDATFAPYLVAPIPPGLIETLHAKGLLPD